jgi:hypothetical protein
VSRYSQESCNTLWYELFIYIHIYTRISCTVRKAYSGPEIGVRPPERRRIRHSWHAVNGLGLMFLGGGGGEGFLACWCLVGYFAWLVSGYCYTAIWMSTAVRIYVFESVGARQSTCTKNKTNQAFACHNVYCVFWINVRIITGLLALQQCELYNVNVFLWSASIFWK